MGFDGQFDALSLLLFSLEFSISQNLAALDAVKQEHMWVNRSQDWLWPTSTIHVIPYLWHLSWINSSQCLLLVSYSIGCLYSWFFSFDVQMSDSGEKIKDHFFSFNLQMYFQQLATHDQSYSYQIKLRWTTRKTLFRNYCLFLQLRVWVWIWVLSPINLETSGELFHLSKPWFSHL